MNSSIRRDDFTSLTGIELCHAECQAHLYSYSYCSKTQTQQFQHHVLTQHTHTAYMKLRARSGNFVMAYSIHNSATVSSTVFFSSTFASLRLVTFVSVCVSAHCLRIRSPYNAHSARLRMKSKTRASQVN